MAPRPVAQRLKDSPPVKIGHFPTDDANVEGETLDGGEKPFSVGGHGQQAEPVVLGEQLDEALLEKGILLGKDDFDLAFLLGYHAHPFFPADLPGLNENNRMRDKRKLSVD